MVVPGFEVPLCRRLAVGASSLAVPRQHAAVLPEASYVEAPGCQPLLEGYQEQAVSCV